MGHRRDGFIRWLAVVLTALLLLAGAKALADAVRRELKKMSVRYQT